LHHFEVRLSHKIRKLFSADAGASLREHAARWTHPVDAKRILATIDPTEIAQISEHYPRRPGARKTNAWQDATHWIDINVGRAQNLWLDRSPPLRILDLGSGAGYFVYVCQFLGHSGLGLDLDDDPFFGAMTKYFNVNRVIWRIEPEIPLPDLGEKFDLVTGHRVCFHRIARDENDVWREWIPADWEFFIHDIRTRFLKPHGRVLLEFLPRPDGSSFFTPELRALFESRGARIFRRKALLAADPNERPRFKQVKH
jgi:SAM-dependent methyltransferase